ncbi:MAG: hypothetical protein GOV02_04240 [Candidatus Aenigmarchaeota archaeon]|nr:hypothetical protein [Candidatus Aenigmarchaeota archaeon]
MPKTLTIKKSEILGLLCAEGCHCFYTTEYNEFDNRPNRMYWRRRKRRRESLEFGNNDPRLLNHFIKLLEDVYNYKRRATGVKRAMRIVIGKRNVMNDLLSFSDFGSSKWSVSKEVKASGIRIKSAFIRGLYEGDGTHVYYPTRNKKPYIDFHMNNGKGLKEVMEILKSINIKCTLKYSKAEDMYRLIIRGNEDVKRFRRIVKPKFKKILLCRGDRTAM